MRVDTVLRQEFWAERTLHIHVTIFYWIAIDYNLNEPMSNMVNVAVNFSVLNIIFSYYVWYNTIPQTYIATKILVVPPESFDEKRSQPLIYFSNLLKIWGLKVNQCDGLVGISIKFGLLHYTTCLINILIILLCVMLPQSIHTHTTTKCRRIKAAFEMTTTMLRSMIIKALTFATPTDRMDIR